MSVGYIVRSSGGGGIQFSINSYSSALNLPATAPNNAYAIISDKDVTRFYISGSEPIEPIADSVWVKNSMFKSDESINVISGDRLLITPFEFLQRSGNSWVHKEAYAFKDGKWIPYKKFLIKDGEYTTLLSELVSPNEFDFFPKRDSSKRSYREFHLSTANRNHDVATATQYDFKKYSRIGIEYSSTESSSSVELGIRWTIDHSTQISSVKVTLEKTPPEITKKAYFNLEDAVNAGILFRDYKLIAFKFNIFTENHVYSDNPFRLYDMWLE